MSEVKTDKPQLQPIAGGEYKIVLGPLKGGDWDFGKVLADSTASEEAGEIEKACNMRYEAFQRLMEIIPDEGECNLAWDDETTQSALLLIDYSAIDHFLVGDFEMCAGMLELLLELDPEDHLEATKELAYCYVALDEQELFDEVINDISDKYADKGILKMWSEQRRAGKIPEGEFIHFKKSFPVYLAEFTSDRHPADEAYMMSIESPRPTKEALARELWLRTEHLWLLFPNFIRSLKERYSDEEK